MENNLWKLFEEFVEMENRLNSDENDLLLLESQIGYFEGNKIKVLSKEQVEKGIDMFVKLNMQKLNFDEAKSLLKSKCLEIANILLPLHNCYIDIGNGKIIGLFTNPLNIDSIPDYRKELKVGEALTTKKYSLIYQREEVLNSSGASL